MAPDSDDFDVPHLDDLTDLLVASEQNLLPELDYGQGDDQWKRIRARAGAVADLHAHILVAQRDASPLTARGQRLEGWGNIWNRPRRGATKASGQDAGLVRGQESASWAVTDVLVHRASGRRYSPTAAGTLDGSGEAFVGVIAEEPGSSGRLLAGEVLEWFEAPAGIEAEVELVADLADGGLDQESEGAYRDRVINRIGQPAQGGNDNDVAQWILEALDEIETPYIWPHRNGLGSVDVAGLKDATGAARALSVDERAAVLAYLNQVRIVTATKRVLITTTEAVNVEIHLTPRSTAQFARDWDDSTPPEVSAYDGGTRKVTLTDDRPASMQAGDRVIFVGTSGAEQVIESLDGDDAFILRAPASVTPEAAQTVRAGGPIIQPVRDAILTLFRTLGPRRGAFGAGGGAAWDDTLRHARIFELAQTAPGVLDSTIVAPAGNVEPAEEPEPEHPEVAYLVAGNVLVRYAG